MNRKTNIPAPVGGSSLLVIFSVLCFSVFSILVLATVKADERLAVSRQLRLIMRRIVRRNAFWANCVPELWKTV